MRARMRAGGGATVVETGFALVTELAGRCRQLPTAGIWVTGVQHQGPHHDATRAASRSVQGYKYKVGRVSMLVSFLMNT
jgi:hypothetical protein